MTHADSNNDPMYTGMGGAPPSNFSDLPAPNTDEFGLPGFELPASPAAASGGPGGYNRRTRGGNRKSSMFLPRPPSLDFGNMDFSQFQPPPVTPTQGGIPENETVSLSGVPPGPPPSASSPLRPPGPPPSATSPPGPPGPPRLSVSSSPGLPPPPPALSSPPSGPPGPPQVCRPKITLIALNT